MAKKKEQKVYVVCPEYKGYLDEMPQEIKDKIKAEKPEVYKCIFEQPTQEVQ